MRVYPVHLMKNVTNFEELYIRLRVVEWVTLLWFLFGV